MRTLFAVLAAMIFVGPTVSQDKKKFDPAPLQGKWTITAGTKMGEKVDEKNLAGEVIITKDSFTIKDSAETHVMSYKLDASKSPVQIDMEGKEGPAKGTTAEGIIELDGDTLKLAYATNIPGFDGKRPEKFESTKDNKAFLFVLKKAK